MSESVESSIFEQKHYIPETHVHKVVKVRDAIVSSLAILAMDKKKFDNVAIRFHDHDFDLESDGDSSVISTIDADFTLRYGSRCITLDRLSGLVNSIGLCRFNNDPEMFELNHIMDLGCSSIMHSFSKHSYNGFTCETHHILLVIPGLSLIAHKWKKDHKETNAHEN